MYLKSAIRGFLDPFPRLFRTAFVVGAKRTSRKLIIRKDTELVIEGYPRSANTYSVVAFEFAQRRAVRIAHHLHSLSQIYAAVEMGIPVIALIRKPEDAVRSHSLIFRQNTDAELRRWIAFYRGVRKVADKVVIAEFDRVTGDFGSIIDEVNAKFGTSFDRFETTEDNVAAVFAEIDQINLRNSHRTDGGKEMYVARPTEAKREASKKKNLQFDPALLAQAHALLAELTR